MLQWVWGLVSHSRLLDIVRGYPTDAELYRGGCGKALSQQQLRNNDFSGSKTCQLHLDLVSHPTEVLLACGTVRGGFFEWLLFCFPSLPRCLSCNFFLACTRQILSVLLLSRFGNTAGNSFGVLM